MSVFKETSSSTGPKVMIAFPGYSVSLLYRYYGKYGDVSLDEVADMSGLAYKRRPSKIGYFLGHSVLDDEPVITTWYDCSLTAIGEGHDGDG